MQYDYIIVGADGEITRSELTYQHVVTEGTRWQKDTTGGISVESV